MDTNKQDLFQFKTKEIRDFFEPINLQSLNFKQMKSLLNYPNLLQLFFKLNNNGISYAKFYDYLFSYLNKYTDKQPLIDSFKNCFYDIHSSNLDKHNINQLENDLNYFNIRDEITKEIDKCLNNKQDFRVFNLFTTVLKRIIDQNKIQEKLKQMIVNENFQSNDQKRIQKIINKNNESNSNQAIQNKIYNLKDVPNNGDFNLAFKFSVDEKCNFYYQKTYNEINEELMKQEVEIYHTDFTNEYPSFIVHSNNELDGNKIIFPYFPFQTLRSFLNIVQKDESNIIFTPIDKLVIIKEICIGLQQLHEHSIYHQNLNSSCMMITNTKDSYISNFIFDPKNEQNQIKSHPSFYYRHPDLIDKPTSLLIKKNPVNEEEELYIKHDIYSFGILMYEIITTSAIDDLFGNKTPQEIINILSNDFKSFIFPNKDDEKDKNDFDSIFGFKGIQIIIEKCMDTKNTYSSMKDILSDLDQLPFNQIKENKFEIDFRIKNAIDINKYECTLSDLVINYYLGNEISKTLIKSLSECNAFKVTPEEVENLNNEEKDIITRILDFFKFENNSMSIEGIPIIYEEPFNSIISKKLIESVVQDYSQFNQNQSKLMSLSIFVNCNDNSYSKINSNQVEFPLLSTVENIMSYFIPIASFDKFTNIFKRAEMIPIYSFFIAKEISIIHSFGLYHGEISPKSIGIYYNTKTNTFLPLIIPFYFFFKNKQKKPTNSQQCNSGDRTKFQQKDFKQFLKIIKQIDETKLIPRYIFELETINSIVFELYNLNIYNEKQNIRSIFTQNYTTENTQYSFFKFRYKDIQEILIDKTRDTFQIIRDFLIINSDDYFDVLKTIENIYKDFYIEKYGLKSTIDENMNNVEKIETMLYYIKELNNSLYIEYKKFEKQIDEDIVIELIEDNTMIIKKPSFENKKDTKNKMDHIKFIVESLCGFKKTDARLKVKLLKRKRVHRCIKLCDNLQYKSFEFLFKRYIQQLYPYSNYQVKVKFEINSIPPNKCYITPNDVINIGDKIGLKGTNIKGVIVFLIDGYFSNEND